MSSWRLLGLSAFTSRHLNSLNSLTKAYKLTTLEKGHYSVVSVSPVSLFLFSITVNLISSCIGFNKTIHLKTFSKKSIQFSTSQYIIKKNNKQINNESSLFHYDLSSKQTQAGSVVKLRPVLNRPLTRAERWNMCNKLEPEWRVDPETLHYLNSGGSPILRRSFTQSEFTLE